MSQHQHPNAQAQTQAHFMQASGGTPAQIVLQGFPSQVGVGVGASAASSATGNDEPPRKIVHLGTFETEKEAARVVRDKYLEIYGEVPGMSQEDLKKLDQDDNVVESHAVADDDEEEEDALEVDEDDGSDLPPAVSAATQSATPSASKSPPPVPMAVDEEIAPDAFGTEGPDAGSGGGASNSSSSANTSRTSSQSRSNNDSSAPKAAR
ncbi:Hypothetical Protein FCC1311_018532 [Hondaea fermentalgiana]|uniref:Uncharacterized protein n=1 Tax=Hondaea fermentalgiana TaxID=2315210 RepID=A0A2R5GCY1_9STRA|nr:Hypothetical Protein FCC1311_018532 [Hondaea fermentalgiana]|eukprot:GBG25634.1 Hypothetical Protein FCC1311_018532 [Hondaea fermentalgiana]